MKPRLAPVDGTPPGKAEPDDGNAISTVRVTRTEDAYVIVEHPEGWTEAEVTDALHARLLDFAPKIQWWGAASRTKLRAVALGTNEPDDPMMDPFELQPEDIEDEDEDEASAVAEEE